MDIIPQIKIKDLIIFQSPETLKLIEKYIISAKQKGVYIGELAINPYIYESRSLDIGYLIRYIESLDNVAGIFREIYDNLIYTLRLQNLVNNEIYEYDNIFHFMFDSINNKFNEYLDDQFLFEDFGIYMSQTSLETCVALCDEFSNNFISLMNGNIDTNILISLCMYKNIVNASYIYDKIFQQFEYIYLPFY